MKKYNLINILVCRNQLVITLIALVVAGQATAQIAYSCNMDGGFGDCGTDWDNNGFIAAYTNADCTGAGTSDVIYDNVYNSGGHIVVGTWNDVPITGHSGNEIELSFRTRLLDYYSPYADRSGTEWGTLKVYYKTTLPDESLPGIQIGTDITSATDCQTHTITFDPGTTITNLYISFIYTWGSGDNDIIFDNISLTETCPSFSTYYSKSSGNLDDLSTWGSNADGTGCSPDNFTTAGVTYNVHNNTAPTTSGAWAVSGAGSKVVFGDPDVSVSFTAGGTLNFDCDIELANDGILNLNDNDMSLEGDLIRSSASAVFNPGPSGTNTITFDGGTDQYVNVTTAAGSTPADADLTFYDVVVSNNSTVRLYYKFSTSKKLNINDLNVNSGSTLHFISD